MSVWYIGIESLPSYSTFNLVTIIFLINIFLVYRNQIKHVFQLPEFQHLNTTAVIWDFANVLQWKKKAVAQDEDMKGVFRTWIQRKQFLQNLTPKVPLLNPRLFPPEFKKQSRNLRQPIQLECAIHSGSTTIIVCGCLCVGVCGCVGKHSHRSIGGAEQRWITTCRGKQFEQNSALRSAPASVWLQNGAFADTGDVGGGMRRGWEGGTTTCGPGPGEENRAVSQLVMYLWWIPETSQAILLLRMSLRGDDSWEHWKLP